MRIAFYAPMKPPTAPRPSGDRRMARLLIQALAGRGHAVALASRFRSWQSEPDAMRQARLADTGQRLAARLVRRYRAHPASRPELWFTYHVYYRAPDWIGPFVADALGIPYVVAEASHAPKRTYGAWSVGHAAAEAAIRRADAVIGLNARDSACLRPLLAEPERLVPLRPFLDAAPYGAAAAMRAAHRPAVLAEFALSADMPLLLAVAMMRAGDKLASYRVLAKALARLRDAPWQLLVVGDGSAHDAVAASRAPFGARIRYAGERAAEALPALYAAADLLVWPAMREAYGMALLEAQATGLPVIAGRSGGVPEIVRDGETGLLAPEGDDGVFAACLRVLLADPARRRAMGARALEVVAQDHTLVAAGRALDEALARAGRARRAA
jgi:glycosyltransferase involved in cell wall biosynthesis